jgi:hypothetical protein
MTAARISMSAFDLIVRLFGLLLGLAMGEVLAGFARTLRLKLGVTAVAADTVRVGWLVPMLGLLVILSQLSFWLGFYELHGNVPLNLLVLLGLLGVVGGFYLVASLVFPTLPEKWPDFDAYYFQVRRTVLGGVIAIELAALAFLAWLAAGGVPLGITTGTPNAIGTAASLLFLPVLAALALVRGRQASLVLLALAVAIPLVEALTRFR